MENLGKKIEVMKARGQLNDLTYEERTIQRQIREIMKKERGKRNKVIMGYRQLIINNENWIWDVMAGQLSRSMQPKTRKGDTARTRLTINDS